MNKEIRGIRRGLFDDRWAASTKPVAGMGASP
jgi:hypothetical protein